MAENQNNKDEGAELLDDDFVFTFTDDNGEPVDFVEEACIEYQGEFYALMVPLHPEDGEEDELYIFKITQEDDDTDVFEMVTDEKLCTAVYDEYVKAVEAEVECGCGCGCGECDDDCHHDSHDDGCGCEDGECGCPHHHHDK